MGIWILVVVTVAMVWAGVLFWLALFAKSRSRLVYWLCGIGLIAWSIGGSAMLAWASYVLRWERGLVDSYFAEAMVLSILAGGGAVAMLVRGGQKRDGGLVAGKWPALKLLGLWLLLGAVQLVIVWRIDAVERTYAQEVEAKLGEQWAELVGPMPQESENAAPLYRQAFAQLDEVLERYTEELQEASRQQAKEGAEAAAAGDEETEPPQDLWGADPVTPADLMSEANLGKAQTLELARRLEPVAGMLREAAGRRSCRFIGPETVVTILDDRPELKRFRQAAMALQLVAKRRAADRDMKGSFEAVRTVHRMANHVDQTSPELLEGLVRIGCHAVAYEAAAKVMEHVHDAAELPADMPWDASGVREQWVRNLRGEDLASIKMLHDFALGKAQGQRNVVIPQRVAIFYRVLWLRTDIEAMQRYFKAARQSFMGERDAFAGILRKDQPIHGSLLVTILTPSVQRAGDSTNNLTGLAGRVQIAGALTRYRIESGAYPETLDALRPKYLAEIPQDPIDGKPMRYVLKGSDAIIYSIGKDRKDDGGDLGEEQWQAKDDGIRLAGDRVGR